MSRALGYVVLAAFLLTAIRLVLVPNQTTIARSVAELVESLLIAGVLVFMVIRPFFFSSGRAPTIRESRPRLAGREVTIRDPKDPPQRPARRVV